MKTHHIRVKSPACDLIRDGTKKIEGRLFKGFFKTIEIGYTLVINKDFAKTVKSLQVFNNFHEMLEHFNLSDVLPRITTIEDGVEHYRKIYKNLSSNYKVLSIDLSD